MLLCSRARVSVGQPIPNPSNDCLCFFWNLTLGWYVPFHPQLSSEPGQGFSEFFLECTCVHCLEAHGCHCVVLRATWWEWPPHRPHFGEWGVVPLLCENRLFLILCGFCYSKATRDMDHKVWFEQLRVRVRREVYPCTSLCPFSFISYGFLFNSMLWVAPTACSWFGCSLCKYSFLSSVSSLRFSTFCFFCISVVC